MGRPIRILLVEDNQVFREALELLLGMRADVEVVAAVGDGSEALPAAEKHRPDVVLMDYRLPGHGRRAGDGRRARRRTRRSRSSCLTASANSREIEALYEAGAAACLTKDQELDVIVDADRSGGGVNLTAAEHGDRPRLDGGLPRRAASASRTGVSCRSTSTSGRRATRTAST